MAPRVSGTAAATAAQPYTLNLTTSTAPDTLSVNWGDGQTETLSSSATTATHAYASAGTFNVTVTATAASSCARWASRWCSPPTRT